MDEVEPQPIGRHERAGLLHVRAQDRAESSMEQMRGRVIPSSRVTDVFDAVHIERLRSIGRLIGSFIETIALLYRERRRRHRVGRLTGIRS
jgi:hypothetical protein